MRKLCKITTDERDFYLLLKLPDDAGRKELDLTLTDGKVVWDTCIDSDQLSKMAGYVYMGLDEYFELTQKALTRKNLGALQVVYQVKVHEKKAELIWKRLSQDNVKFQLGSLLLRMSTDQTLDSILDFSFNQLTSCEEKIHSLTVDIEKQLSERATWTEKLKRLVVDKEDNENKLFSKFVVTLNLKKAKIRRLQDTVKQLSEQIASLERGERKSVPQPPVMKKETSTGGGHSDRDTTDDEEGSDSRSQRGKSSDPSCTKGLISPSLMLDDVTKDDEDDGAPILKRKRQRGVQAKGPSNIPKIPKVTPVRTRSSSSTSSEGTMSKPLKLSPTQDPDKLFDEM